MACLIPCTEEHHWQGDFAQALLPVNKVVASSVHTTAWVHHVDWSRETSVPNTSFTCVAIRKAADLSSMIHLCESSSTRNDLGKCALITSLLVNTNHCFSSLLSESYNVSIWNACHKAHFSVFKAVLCTARVLCIFHVCEQKHPAAKPTLSRMPCIKRL